MYWAPLEAVPSFKYLGRILSSTDNNWPAVEKNLQQAQGKWGLIVKILGIEGADRRTVGRFYVAVVQALILFGLETWVVYPQLYKALVSFHHRTVQRVSGMGSKLQLESTWLYPPIGVALAMVLLDDIGVYINRRQNRVAQ